MKQGWIQVEDNGTDKPFAPKTLADLVYMDNQESLTLKEAIQRHAPIDLLARLPAKGWSSGKPYTQTVEVAGLLETDVPLADVVLSNTTTTAYKEIEDYGFVGRMDAKDESLKAYCYEEKPTVDLTVRLKVVR